MSSNDNASLAFRPLRGGIAIHNPLSDATGGRFGTLGFIATSDGVDRWLVSCYHVLCRFSGQFPANAVENIFQPSSFQQQVPVAVISAERADFTLDCAAARDLSGQGLADVLGIGQLAPPVAPVAGMRVIKSGSATGVTEGRILKVSVDEVEIVPMGFPGRYDLTEAGDSGALWVDAATHAPVAMHYRGNVGEMPERAFARPILPVLDSLKLRFI